MGSTAPPLLDWIVVVVWAAAIVVVVDDAVRDASLTVSYGDWCTWCCVTNNCCTYGCGGCGFNVEPHAKVVGISRDFTVGDDGS